MGHVAETDPMAAKIEMAASFMTEKRGAVRSEVKCKRGVRRMVRR